MYLVAVVLIPFLAALTIALLPSDSKNRESLLSIIAASTSFILIAIETSNMMNGNVVVEHYRWIDSFGLEFKFRLDGFAYIFALLVSGMGALISLYARYYMDPNDPRARFYAFFLIFMGAMLGLVLSGNVIQMVIFWELTSMASFMLIAYWYHRADARHGARVSFTITATGGFALLASVLLMGYEVGSYDLDVILASGDLLRESPYYTLIVLTFALGAMTKSAQFPFHFWLPSAMAAPTPVSAYLHSATLVKVGIFALIRFWPVLSSTDLWLYLISGIGFLTFVIGAYNALFQRDLKGILAYSTVSHLGMIVALIGMNTKLALIVAIFHILNHAAFKASLFMAVGIIDHKSGTRDITILGGLRKAMPLTALLATIATASMAGVPLLNGFLSKEMFFAESFVADPYGYIMPSIALFGSLFSVAYSYRLITQVFFGEPNLAELPKKPKEAPKIMLLPIAFLVAICVAVGLFPNETIRSSIEVASTAVLGESYAFEVALWHGVNLPLIMSIVALVGGVILAIKMSGYLCDNPNRTPLTERFDGRTLYERFMERVDATANFALSWSSSNRMQVQLLLVVLITILVGAMPLFNRFDAPALDLMEINWLFMALWVVGGLAAILTAYHAQYSRFRAIVFTGITGIVVVATFAWLSALDLALTQFVVEVVTTVLLLLGLRWLPRPIFTRKEMIRDRITAIRRYRDLVFAITAGAGMTLLSYFLMSRPSNENDIGEMVLQESYPVGHGTNAVNVTLVDFRGFDTFGEIVVLGIVALTVFALLRRFRPPQEMLLALEEDREELTTDLRRIREDGKLPQGTMLVPNVIARWLLPITMLIAFYFFFRGHNLPGGGFVGGLVFAVAIIMQFIISGLIWVEAKSRIRPLYWLGAGLLLAVGAGILPMFFGLPFLTAMVWEPVLPLYGQLHLSTVLLFDAGVFVLVVGTTTYMLIALAHQSLRFHRKNIYEDASKGE